MRRDALHIYVLAAFAVAQPLFDVLARGPEFFLVERYRPVHVLAAALIPSLVVPTALVLAERLARLAGRRAGRALHALFVATLLGAVVLPILGRSVEAPGATLVAAAALLGVAAAAAYLRFAVLSGLVTALAPAVLVFPALFLLRPPIAPLVWPPAVEVVPGERGGGPPIVMVVFDALPTTALVDDRWRIDAARHPHLAALARDATWFRNATTVASVTQAAVGAALTGRWPAPTTGTEAYRTRNLFTLLGGSYDLRVTESYVKFCADEVCGGYDPEATLAAFGPLVRDLAVLWLHVVAPSDLRRDLPDLGHAVLLLAAPGALANEGATETWELLERQREINEAKLSSRADIFASFIESIDARGTLYYLHALLPHAPYVYLPSGRVCTPGRLQEPAEWGPDAAKAAQAYAHFQLQVGFVDTLVGRLVAHLKAKALYDDTLLVVLADHGVSHRPNDQRRALTRTNYCDVAPIPLFVKRPHQREGAVSDRNVELIDVLPTIAAILGVPIPWPVDGQAAIDPTGPERAQKTILGPYWPAEKALFGSEPRLAFPAFRLREACAPRDAPASGRPRDRELVGRPLADLAVEARPSMRVEIARAGLYDDVDPTAEFGPCAVAGRVAASADGTRLALAVNGTVRAVTEVGRGRDGWSPFSMAVPETTFVAGRNRIEVFTIGEHDGRPLLAATRGGAGRTWALDAPGATAGTVLRSSDGRVRRVGSPTLVGEVERIPGGGSAFARFRGWAADTTRAAAPDTVIVFAGGKFFGALPLGTPRPDVPARSGETGLARSGFAFKVPVARDAAPESLRVRVFALAPDGAAAELAEGGVGAVNRLTPR